MKKNFLQKFILPLLAFLLVACGTVTTSEDVEQTETNQEDAAQEKIVEKTAVVEGEAYDTPYEVAEYIDLYGWLPDNYLTKDEARDLGWVAKEGNLWDVAPGMSIGGDYFGNFEGLLPEADGREYTEADIEYEGGHRNAKRLVFSNDGLYFYTDDHYESFEEIEVGENE